MSQKPGGHDCSHVQAAPVAGQGGTSVWWQEQAMRVRGPESSWTGVGGPCNAPLLGALLTVVMQTVLPAVGHAAP